MRKLYTLGHSRCRLQSHAQVGASSPFTHCTRFVFVLMLLLGGVTQGVEGQTAIPITSYSPTHESSNVPQTTNKIIIGFNQLVKFSNTKNDLTTRQIAIWQEVEQYNLDGDYTGMAYTKRIAYISLPKSSTTLFASNLSTNISQSNSNSSLELTLSGVSLEYGASYSISISNNLIVSDNGSEVFTGLSSGSYWFKVELPSTPPTLVAENALSPATGATGVSLSPTLSMTFNEAVVKPVGVSKFLTIRKSDGTFVDSYNIESSSIVVSDNLVSIPVTGLVADISYYVTVEAGFVKSSTSGVPYAGISDPNTWTFTTGPAPQLSVLSPTHNATGVPLGANLTATFDVPVRFNSGSESKLISIIDPSGSFNYVVANGASSPAGVSIVGNVLTIDPSSNFEFGTNYSVSIQSGALESMGGIPFAGIAAADWSFTTVDAPAPVGTMVTPVASDVNISILTDVVINYDMAIRNTEGTAITDANVKNLINIYQGSGDGVLMASNNYTATIAADKKSITIRMLPGSSYLPNTDVRVVISPVENNQGKHNEAQTFAFKTGYYNIWSGITDSDWTNVSNWGGSYTEGASVIINTGGNGAILNRDLSIPNMIIAAGGKLTINSGAKLTVTSYFRMFSVNGTGASASLVVDGTLTTDATKTFVYQGITNSTFNYYVSSPVNAAVKSVVNPNGRMYAYNTATDVFDRLADNAVLTPLKGYGAMAPAGSWLSFSGSLNGGDYSLPCNWTAKNYGWNLAGNPYPCAIDLQKTYDRGDFVNLFDHIYMRDNQTLQQNAYNFKSKVGTLGGNAVVPAMHSFWVQVKPGFSDGSFSVKNIDRVHNSYNYHKSASATPVQKPTVKLFAQNGTVKDLSVITFIPGNDDAYDDYDSEKRLARNNLVTDLYTIKDGMRLVINSFGEYSGSKEVPIGVYATKAGTYTLGIASLAGFDQEVELKLVDYGISPSTTHDLSSGDYSFTLAGNTYTDHRFVLQVSNKVATGVEQPEANREVTIYAFQSDVVIENKGDAIGQYTIYDLSGRVLSSGEVGAFSKISVPMPVKGVVLGVVKTSKGMVNQKLLIQ